MSPYQTIYWQIAEWLMAQQYPWAIVVTFFILAWVVARALTAIIVEAR